MRERKRDRERKKGLKEKGLKERERKDLKRVK